MAGGIEGLVIKEAADAYPTRDGQRVWKVKAKTSLDMIAIGFTGPAAAPSTLGWPSPATSTTVASCVLRAPPRC